MRDTLARAIAALVVMVLTVSAPAGQSPVRYIYDELGRLIAVIDTSGAAAIYSYDAVGNLLSIVRQNTGVVSILEFSPNGGSIGQGVRLYGTGFSATPSQNTVTFNGVSATVTSSTATEIVTTVPATATTGTIAVATPSGSATSATAFVVGTSDAPTISSVSPGDGVASTAVTVTGTNFATTGPQNRLLFNTSPAPITSASATSITTAVPASATSGKIRVATQAGEAVSASDFIVAPPPYAVSDIAVTDRMTPGTSKTVTIGTANKIGLVLFDATAGQRVSLAVGKGMSSIVRLLNHDATTIDSASAGIVEAFLDAVVLRATGTYTILVDPVGSATGSITVTLHDVPADAAGAIAAGGSSVTATTTVAGQNGRYPFAGVPGQRVSLTVGAGPGGKVRLVGPDLETIGSVSIPVFGIGFIDTQTLVLAGTHAVIVDYTGKNVGSVALTLYDVPADLSATLTAGGAGVAAAIGTPGQNGEYSFSGTTGQRVSLLISNVSMTAGVSVRTSTGSVLGSATVTALAAFIEPVSLPSTGTYIVRVDPSLAHTGSVTLNLYDVDPDVTGTLTINAVATNLSLPAEGQNASFTFSGTASQQITVRVTNADIRLPAGAGTSVTVKLLRPDGTVLTSTTSFGTTFNLTTQTLATTGTYTVIVDPNQAGTGTLSLRVTNP